MVWCSENSFRKEAWHRCYFLNGPQLHFSLLLWSMSTPFCLHLYFDNRHLGALMARVAQDPTEGRAGRIWTALPEWARRTVWVMFSNTQLGALIAGEAWDSFRQPVQVATHCCQVKSAASERFSSSGLALYNPGGYTGGWCPTWAPKVWGPQKPKACWQGADYAHVGSTGLRCPGAGKCQKSLGHYRLLEVPGISLISNTDTQKCTYSSWRQSWRNPGCLVRSGTGQVVDWLRNSPVRDIWEGDPWLQQNRMTLSGSQS